MAEYWKSSLIGGMDVDTSNTVFDSEKGAVRFRKNCKILTNREGETGMTTGVLGTEEHMGREGATELLVIESKTEQALIIFSLLGDNEYIDLWWYNNLTVGGPHMINILTSDGWMNWESTTVLSADVMGDNLVWCHGNDYPRFLDIKRAYGRYLKPAASDYYRTLDESVTRLARGCPTEAPSVWLRYEENVSSNNFVNKIYQFAYYFVYKDYSKSLVSPYSDLVYVRDILNQTGSFAQAANVATVTFPSGGTEVQEVVVVARNGNIGVWYEVYHYEKEYFFEEPNLNISFDFKGNIAKVAISDENLLDGQSYVPERAEIAKFVGNSILLAEVTLGKSATAPSLILSKAEGTEALPFDVSDLVLIPYPSGSSEPDIADLIYFDITFPTAFEVGNINWDIAVSRESDRLYRGTSWGADIYYGPEYYSHMAFRFIGNLYVTEDDTREEVIANLLAQWQLSLGIRDRILWSYNKSWEDFFGNWDGPTVSGVTMIDGDTLRVTMETLRERLAEDHTQAITAGVGTENNTINGFMPGGTYQVGVQYYSEHMDKVSGVLLSKDDYQYQFDSFSDESYKLEQLQWKLNGGPSETWAKYYKILTTKCLDISETLVLHPSSLIRKGTTEEFVGYIGISLPTALGYTFILGDYVSFSYQGIHYNIPVGGVSSAFIIDSSEQYLYFEGSNIPFVQADMDVPDQTFSNIRVFRFSTVNEENLFYEASPTYEIVDGEFSVKEGIITGDTWLLTTRTDVREWDDVRDKVIVTQRAILSPSFALNKDVGVMGYSQGRPYVELADFSEENLHAIMWGGRIINGSRINQLRIFDPIDNYQDLNEKYGKVTGISQIGDTIRVVQETKEISFSVERDVITDASGSLITQSIGNLLGAGYTFLKDNGTTYPKSVVVNDSNAYYWDGLRGEVVRSNQNNGQYPISQYGMRSYFRDVKERIDKSNNHDVIFYIDKEYNELVCLFQIDGETEGLVFLEEENIWTSFIDDTIGGEIPRAYSNIGSRLFTLHNGKIYERNILDTPSNIVFGEQRTSSLGLSFNVLNGRDKQPLTIRVVGNEGLTGKIESEQRGARNLPFITRFTEEMFRIDGSYLIAPIHRNINTTFGEDDSMILRGARVQGLCFAISLYRDTPFHLKEFIIEYINV